MEYCQWHFVLPVYVRVLTWFTSLRATKEKSLTANELCKLYMGMTFEERNKFSSIFKQLYDAQVLASKPMTMENRSRLKKMDEEND